MIPTFNVRKQDEPLQGSGRDWEPIADLITSHHPDVVLLQELDGTSAKPTAPSGRPLPGAAVDRRQADRLAPAQPLRKIAHPRRRERPRTRLWLLRYEPAPVRFDDESLCPGQLPGQQVLLTLPRTLTPEMAERLKDRPVPDMDVVHESATCLAAEQGLSRG